jgi:type IV pilus assembly protein PilC
MPAYSYRAVHTSGQMTRGQRQAANEWELAQHLNYAGLELVEARIKKETRASTRWCNLSPRKLAVFCSQMADLLQAGVPFIESLRDITASYEAGFMRDALTDILRDINHGTHIATAFSSYNRLFPSVFIAILSAGEISGDLSETFTQLTRFAESRAKTTEQLRRALRYPLFLLFVAFGVVSFMMVMVVPKVISFLNTIDSELPVITRILITVSDLFAKVWWEFLLAIPLSAFLISFARANSEKAALTTDALLLRLPMLGGIIHKLALARFAHSFAILFQSGIGIVASLRSAKATLNNKALEAVIDDVVQQVQSGQSLSLAMTGTLPHFAVRMIRTGEQSGQLGKSLNDIATAYDREVTDVTERTIGMLEPALTILIGMLLAWTVLAVLGPIYGSLSKLGGQY